MGIGPLVGVLVALSSLPTGRGVAGASARAGDVVIDGRKVPAPDAGVGDPPVWIGAGHGAGPVPGVVLLRSGVTAHLNCHGGGARIGGNGDHLTLDGCSALEVLGDHDEIQVEVVGAALLSVRGDGNHVVYRTRPGARARVVVLGSGDKVTQDRTEPPR